MTPGIKRLPTDRTGIAVNYEKVARLDVVQLCTLVAFQSGAAGQLTLPAQVAVAVCGAGR